MKIAYSPEADVLTIQLGEGPLSDSRDIAEGVIVHLSGKEEPLFLPFFCLARSGS
jgi:uncharacterized protein YuzE